MSRSTRSLSAHDAPAPLWPSSSHAPASAFSSSTRGSSRVISPSLRTSSRSWEWGGSTNSASGRRSAGYRLRVSACGSTSRERRWIFPGGAVMPRTPRAGCISIACSRRLLSAPAPIYATSARSWGSFERAGESWEWSPCRADRSTRTGRPWSWAPMAGAPTSRSSQGRRNTWGTTTLASDTGPTGPSTPHGVARSETSACTLGSTIAPTFDWPSGRMAICSSSA